jgi:SSS family transporter
MLASSQFILFQLGRLAVVLLLPALALSTVAGIDVLMSILVVGILCVIYTLFGGMKAVIWTDAVQAVVLLLGAGWALGHLLHEIPGGITTVVQTVQDRERFFHSVPWSWDVTVASGWFIMLGSLFSNLFSYTASQDVVQRYVTTRDEQGARRAIWGNVLLSPVAQALFFAIGSCLLAYYVHFPARLNVALENDAVFPQFIVQQMPAGLAGLLVAAIFAASQSTISSSLNSVSTAYVVDFHRRWAPQSSDAAELRLARWVTAIAGATGILIAIVLAKSGIPKSLWETFLTVVGLFSGAISGLFVLGIFSRRANGPGALVGGLTSVGLVMVVYWNQWTTFWLFSVIGVLSCVFVGWVTSLGFAGGPVDVRLTLYGLNRPQRSVPPQG